MGVASRHGSTPVEFSDLQEAKILERQSSRRKCSEKSILDDIMGDPDDFKDLVDPEEDGGRWEDTVREALNSGEEENGALNGEMEKEKRKVQEVDKSTNAGCDKVCDAHGTRYFVVKSLNHQNLSKSIEKGIWATQAMNEGVLNEAFQSSERVILVFSVNMSGHFQGYAQMTSSIGRRKANVWNDSNDGSTSPWGGVFSVKWIRLHELPFQETAHLKNPLNNNKPVKISRDCQELPKELGAALCALIDAGADRDNNPKRKLESEDSTGIKKPRGISNGSILVTHPPEAQRPSGVQSKLTRSPQKTEMRTPYTDKREKDNSIERERSRDRDKERESERRRDKERAASKEADREHWKSRRHVSDVLEEDLLNMTYEEYLQKHSRAYQQFGPPVPPFGPWMGMGIPFPEDPYSMANWRPETFYGSVPYGGIRPYDPKWRGQRPR